MKQGTTFSMAVVFDGVDISNVQSIEFMFKSIRDRMAKVKKTAVYPGDVVLDETRQAFLVPWTTEETYQFTGQFYMDTRITYKDTTDNPETPIISLVMNPTLFDRGD